MGWLYIILAGLGSGLLFWYSNKHVDSPSGFGKLPYWIAAALWPVFVGLMSRCS